MAYMIFVCYNDYVSSHVGSCRSREHQASAIFLDMGLYENTSLATEEAPDGGDLFLAGRQGSQEAGLGHVFGRQVSHELRDAKEPAAKEQQQRRRTSSRRGSSEAEAFAAMPSATSSNRRLSFARVHGGSSRLLQASVTFRGIQGALEGGGVNRTNSRHSLLRLYQVRLASWLDWTGILDVCIGAV